MVVAHQQVNGEFFLTEMEFGRETSHTTYAQVICS